MAHRIEVGFREGMTDASGESARKGIAENLGIRLDSVRTIDVFTIDAELTKPELQDIGGNLFADPVIQEFSLDSPHARDYDWIIEVGFRPGVTDNVGRTSMEAIRDMLKKPVRGIHTSRQYVIRGDITREDADRIASGFLANRLIERWDIRHFSDGAMTVTVPRVELRHSPAVGEIDLDVPDGELMRISREGVLALSLDEMKAIKAYYSRDDVRKEREGVGLGSSPTDVELEALAQTWSEHCKHKTFNALITYTDGKKKDEINSLFNTYIRKSTGEIFRKKDWLISVFRDNAGIIRFNKGWNMVMKVETHNSPSALDPYGGALTGIVGVNRDPLGTGMGSRLVANTNVFCFASPFHDGVIPERLMHPKRILEGVRRGVEHGGNKSGIPTVNGSLVFDSRYLGKPLVYCGTIGIMPARINNRPSHAKEIGNGDLAVMCGGRIGKDGIHGATFSSEELHEDSPATAVQIGDPITQKKMADFLLEARDLGLYKTLTDNGAGGLSSSIGELAQISGGCEIHVDRCPLKYPGLDPWEILLSEAQERMTVVVPPGSLDRFMKLAGERDVECTVVGKFTDTGRFRVLLGDRTIGYLDMDFLHNGLPQMKLDATWEPPSREEPDFPEPRDLAQALRGMLSRLNICSKEYVVRQYDHEVQGGSVVKPLTGEENDGPSDAAVIRPLLDSPEGIVTSHGICPRYSDIDTYHMAACAIDEAVRNAISVGADPEHMAGLDNFCWCDAVKSKKTPDGEYKLAQLVRANRALYDYTTRLGVPCISGKDSMKNDYMIGDVKISIPPTLLFSVIARISDVSQAVTMDTKRPGDMVYVLGMTRDELGASEYYAMKGFVGRNVPRVDMDTAAERYRSLHGAMKRGIVSSCHDCSDGGLGVALAETAFAGNLGMETDLRKVPAEGIDRSDRLLFSESPGRFVVTVSPGNRKAFEGMVRGDIACIGTVTDSSNFTVRGLDGSVIIKSGIRELKEAWKKTLAW
jgi:phosphoribosylformylglycinamidine synthase II